VPASGPGPRRVRPTMTVAVEPYGMLFCADQGYRIRPAGPARVRFPANPLSRGKARVPRSDGRVPTFPSSMLCREPKTGTHGGIIRPWSRYGLTRKAK